MATGDHCVKSLYTDGEEVHFLFSGMVYLLGSATQGEGLAISLWMLLFQWILRIPSLALGTENFAEISIQTGWALLRTNILSFGL